MTKANVLFAILPLLLYVIAAPLIVQLDVSKDARQVVLIVGAVVCLLAAGLVIFYTRRASR